MASRRSASVRATLGACHALELPFVFDNLDDPECAALLGAAPPQRVADSMHGAWVAFAASGDPGWPVYDDRDRLIRRFGPSGELVTDDWLDVRAAWDGAW